jgi:hypothetical protein
MKGNALNYALQKLRANIASLQPSGMGGQQESHEAQVRFGAQGGKHIGVPGHFWGVQATSHNSTRVERWNKARGLVIGRTVRISASSSKQIKSNQEK